MSFKSRSLSVLRNNKFKIELAKFLKEKDVPQWYRAFSTFQLNAADKLMTAIRDDVEQDTAHRVRYCLSVLGLEPLLDNKNLKLLMQLSGGNDLAFLWFLMESHYKTPNENEYSLNEQLILSSIAHLDMITTLRGLDGLLPSGHKSKRTIAKFNANIVNKNHEPKQLHIATDDKFKPYFQRQERPKQNNLPQKLKRPDYKVKFRTYEKYQDANYEPPNEKNRWFAMYTFKESVRIPLTELRLYFDGFFKEIGKNNTNEKTAISIIDSALKNLDMYNEKTSLCLHHQRELESLKQKRMLQDVEKRQTCLESLDNFDKKRKVERLARIHESLNKEVAIYRAKYKEKVKTNKKYLQMLSKDTYSEYSIKDDDDSDCDCALVPSTTEAYNNHVKKIGKNVADAQLQDHQNKTRLLGGGNLKRETSFSDVKNTILSETDRLYIQRYDYGHRKIITPKASQLFFESPTNNQPYKFNYEKIFNCDYYFDREKFIKKVCARMLMADQNEAIDNCYNIPIVGEVARKYADTKWEGQQQKMRQYYHHTRKAIGLASIENFDAQQSTPELPEGIPAQGFYDCEDKELMHRMLRIALEHLAKNPKYVLACLPDCHKMPVLREWIYQRYGKRYTHAERVADFAHSLKMLMGINNMKLGVRIPNTGDVSNNTYLPPKSTCHKYMRKKVKRLRDDYFQQTNKAYMENARLMWLTMNNAMCSISQRDIFFSYMPQRMTDLHHISPWKLREVKDMKTWHEKKQKALRSNGINQFGN